MSTEPNPDPGTHGSGDPAVDTGERVDGTTDDGYVENDRPVGESRRRILSRERDEFGGVKVGSAFFGWLTATGTAVLLTALLAAAGAAVGVTSGSVTNTNVTTGTDMETVGLVGGIALLLILFVAYYCGGYVAGRMARFDGAKQGLAVWIWAVVIAVLVAIVAAIAGAKYDVLSTVNSFPRIPVAGGNPTTGGVIALVAVALSSLLGAVLGGLGGMRFHRKVDAAGLAG